MSRNLYLKLNNYNYTDDYIELVKTFLRSGRDLNSLPADYSNYQRNHFRNQYRDFEMRGNDVYYRPLNLRVVKESEKQQTMQALYNDFTVGLGAGIRSFYNKITDRYLGIKRNDINNYLQHQQYYQLTKYRNYPINRPIIALYSNHRWAIDLVDMGNYRNQNNNFKWILTVIDYFSKKVFAEALLNKDAVTVRNALDNICQTSNTYPIIIQSDNGGEFKNAILRTWATNNNVKLVNTLSYTPQSNGLIENFNNILRKMIREGFIRNNNLNWVNYLPLYIQNRNNSKHSTTKQTPNEIWTAGTGNRLVNKMTDQEKDQIREEDPIPQNNQDRLKKATVKLEDKARNMLDRSQRQRYQVGDHVRVLMSSLQSEIRRRIKSGEYKYVPVRYSPEIFVVDKVMEPQGEHRDFTFERYTLRHQNGNILQTELKRNDPNAVRGAKIFFSTELLRVDDQALKEVPVISNNDANRLNKLSHSILLEAEEKKKKYAEEAKRKKEEAKKKRLERVNEPVVIEEEVGERRSGRERKAYNRHEDQTKLHTEELMINKKKIKK